MPKKLIYLFIILLNGCNQKVDKPAVVTKSWSHLSYMMDGYTNDEMLATVDYLAAYKLTCDAFQYSIVRDYEVVEKRMLYQLKQNRYENIFSYEVIAPVNRKILDDILFRLSYQYCNPRPEDVINDVYVVDNAFLILLHTHKADKQKFEDMLQRKFSIQKRTLK